MVHRDIKTFLLTAREDGAMREHFFHRVVFQRILLFAWSHSENKVLALATESSRARRLSLYKFSIGALFEGCRSRWTVRAAKHYLLANDDPTGDLEPKIAQQVELEILGREEVSERPSLRIVDETGTYSRSVRFVIEAAVAFQAREIMEPGSIDLFAPSSGAE